MKQTVLVFGGLVPRLTNPLSDWAILHHFRRYQDETLNRPHHYVRLLPVHYARSAVELPYSTQELLGYAAMISALSVVYFAIKHYRDEVMGGRVSLGKSLTIGLTIYACPADVCHGRNHWIHH